MVDSAAKKPSDPAGHYKTHKPCCTLLQLILEDPRLKRVVSLGASYRNVRFEPRPWSPASLGKPFTRSTLHAKKHPEAILTAQSDFCFLPSVHQQNMSTVEEVQ